MRKSPVADRLTGLTVASFFAAVAGAFLVPSASMAQPDAAAATTPSSAAGSVHNGSSARWLSGLGVGFRAGGCFLSGPTNGRKFIRGAALGPELDWGVFAMGPHRVVLGAGFLWFSPEREDGPAAVKVATEYSRFDFTVGYDFTWSLLVVGVQVGMGLGVNRVTTSYGDPGWEVIDGQEVLFSEPTAPEVKRRTGADPGLLAGLSIGVELGELWGVPDLLEIRAESDYMLRGARNEFTAMGAIVFWPTALSRRSIEAK